MGKTGQGGTAASGYGIQDVLQVTRLAMRGGLALIALVILSAAPSRAQTTLGTLDLTGIDVPGSTTAAAPIIRTLAVGPGTVDQVEFNFTVQHFGISFGSETRINIIAPDGTSRLYVGGADFGFGATGTWSFSGTLDFGPADAAGTWTFHFWDSFNDGLDPDHTYLAGSVIRLQDSGAAIPLGLDLSVGSASLTRGQAMTLNRPGFTGGQNSRRIAHHGTESKEDLEAVFT